jgi:hypothetical protein
MNSLILFSDVMLYSQKRSQCQTLETNKCQLIRYTNFTSTGTTLNHGEISHSMMNMIPEKLKIATSVVIWRKKTKRAETNI